jgi:hypothetical protein
MMALLLFLLLQAAAPRAGISGSVIDAGTAHLQPLFDARVELIRPSGSPIVTRTDANGRFEFPGLPAGRYRVSVTRDGYQRKSATIQLTTGQQRNDVLMELDLAPTLFGHVRDPYNVPIANALVEAIKVVYGPRGDRSVEAVESALTDDRGEYHLYWLDPGEYYIRASSLVLKPGATIPGNDPAAAPGPTYAPTYFPGFRDPKEAASIQLRVGSNLSAFDFKLQPTSRVDLWGNISIQSTGESVGTAITAALAGSVASVQKFEGRSIAPGLLVPSREVGEFKLSGMLPGTYVVSAQYLSGGQQLVVHRKFTLKGMERAFVLKLIPGSTVVGLAGFVSSPGLDLRSVRVALDSVDSDLPSPSIASLGANGQFSVSRVEPGDYALRFVDLPGDVYVKSARSGEVDIQTKPLRVGEISPDAIRVVLGADGGRLDGSVLDSADRPFGGADVVLVPDSRRRNSPDQYRVTSSEGDGRFTLRGIPPGDYKLFAWQSIEPNAYLNDLYMTGYESFGVPLTIAPNAVGSISLRLIPMN